MRIGTIISIASLCVLVAALLIFGYWAIMPYKLQGKIAVSAVVGDRVLVALYDLPIESEVVYITLENDNTIIVPQFVQGQADNRTLKITIPENVPYGRYRIFLKIAVPVNPLREAKVVIASDEFELKQ